MSPSQSPTTLNFHNRVVLVTGAGRGLGLEYCKEFAKRGATVVVNDLDTSRSGNENNAAESSAPLAQQVASQLSQDYGVETMADTHSVMESDVIIKAIMAKYGRIDVIVNNAGILRDRTFNNMSEKEWNQVYEVHLLSAMRMVKSAWPVFREQNFGRVIFISSPAGIYGSRGQANYSSMKSALIGLTKTLSIEGKRHNILVNAVAPLAATRMSQGVIPGIQMFQAEKIAPLVAYLGHESLKESGSLLETAGGYIGKLRWERSGGCSFKAPTVESIAENWENITRFDEKSTHPASGAESFMQMGKKLRSAL